MSVIIDETLNSARSNLVLSLHTRRTSDSTRGPVCQLLAITSESGAESEGEKFRDEGDYTEKSDEITLHLPKLPNLHKLQNDETVSYQIRVAQFHTCSICVNSLDLVPLLNLAGITTCHFWVLCRGDFGVWVRFRQNSY